jgi:hypothetical protein
MIQKPFEYVVSLEQAPEVGGDFFYYLFLFPHHQRYQVRHIEVLVNRSMVKRLDPTGERHWTRWSPMSH